MVIFCCCYASHPSSSTIHAHRWRWWVCCHTYMLSSCIYLLSSYPTVIIPSYLFALILYNRAGWLGVKHQVTSYVFAVVRSDLFCYIHTHITTVPLLLYISAVVISYLPAVIIYRISSAAIHICCHRTCLLSSLSVCVVMYVCAVASPVCCHCTYLVSGGVLKAVKSGLALYRPSPRAGNALTVKRS